MRPAYLGERIRLVNAGLDAPGNEHVEQLTGHGLEIAAPGDVTEQRRAGKEQRPAPDQLRRIDRRYRAGRITEADKHP